ncbi:MAG: histidine--tRNA ligase [Ilumatobacteraceae bacterium]|nr:histidine--tRNA ligase [Ilumatobacteraceae bacterium]
MPTFQTSPGTRDILPPDAARWRQFNAIFADTVEAAGYGCIIPPIFEDATVFHRIGEATDVVSKEMYDFEDKGGRHVSLRPEQTASVCRAFAQHRPTTPWKVWYTGPNFRYEKAQAGRYRQFDQVGIEALGVHDSDLDVEVIALAWKFYQRLGLSNVQLVINSLGDDGDRARYVDALRQYLQSHQDALTPEARQTLERNPLRVLDSKRQGDLDVIASAPTIKAFLSVEANEHFEKVLTGLRALAIPFTQNEYLVRGLDYYRRTSFEFVSTALESAQNAIGGGGRYDGLVQSLGGPDTPGIGFALGLDRTLLACDAEGVFGAPKSSVDVFVVDVIDGTHALAVTNNIQDAGYSADRAFDGRSMKAQMKSADRSGARFAIIIAQDEVASGSYTIRDMASAQQQLVAKSDLVEFLTRNLGKRTPRRSPS